MRYKNMKTTIKLHKSIQIYYNFISNFVSHFYISYSDVNDISYFISKTHFEFRPEDGFTNKPKHVANLIF